MKKGFIQRLIVPGLIFQSSIIGGGYATGRELIEFFLQLGPLAALVAMLISTVVISAVCAIAFELARKFSLYDYKSFFQKLLGPGWFVFELSYIALLILVLSVIGAASGELIHSLFGGPMIFGSIVLMTTICVLVFLGSRAIELFLSSWSIVLYLAYIILLIWSFIVFGDDILANLVMENQPNIDANAFYSGWKFSGYNVIMFMSVLFVVRHFIDSKDALIAGILCGPLGMIPGLLLLIALVAHYPEIIHETLPINYLLNQLDFSQFTFVFQIVIFGTFIETGAALLHAINERISKAFEVEARIMPQYLRPIFAIILLAMAIYVADSIGLVALIGQGYVYSTYVFLLIVVLPMLTRGLWLVVKKQHVVEK